MHTLILHVDDTTYDFLRTLASSGGEHLEIEASIFLEECVVNKLNEVPK